MIIQRGFDKKYCEEFQNQLTYDRIDSIWKTFREAGNSIEGRIIKLNFKKVINRFGIKNQKFLDQLFDRFKLDKSIDKNDKQQIDIQDFVIGLAVLSRITFIDKVKFIFYLTDLDQDGCLSLEEIQNMIERVQKIFCKENSTADIDSLMFDLAHKKATRNYNEMLVLLKRNNKQLKNDEGSLITGDQFIEALKLSKDLYLEQKFIPLNLSLNEIIDNVACQPCIRISQNIKKTFVEFRQQLGSIMQQSKNQKDSGIIKYPGRVEIMKNNKVIQVLPNIEKNADKKAQKNNNKTKNPNNMKINNDYKQISQQKNAQQNLQTYKAKVKKMIQTKEDPRLNVHYQNKFKK